MLGRAVALVVRAARAMTENFMMVVEVFEVRV
jgi:hypothetical protein